MEPVDGLHRGGRIEERGVGQGALGDVDQQPEPVGGVLVEGPLQAEHDRPGSGGSVEARVGSPSIAKSVAPAGTNSPSAGRRTRQQSASRAMLDELVVADVGDARRSAERRSRRRRLGPRRPALGVLLVEQPAGVRADQLDQRRHPERLADVVHVDDQHDDADHHQHEGHHDREARAPGPRPRTSPRAWRAWRGRRWRRRSRSPAGWACPGGTSGRCAARTGPWPTGPRPS